MVHIEFNRNPAILATRKLLLEHFLFLFQRSQLVKGLFSFVYVPDYLLGMIFLEGRLTFDLSLPTKLDGPQRRYI